MMKERKSGKKQRNKQKRGENKFETELYNSVESTCFVVITPRRQRRQSRRRKKKRLTYFLHTNADRRRG